MVYSTADTPQRTIHVRRTIDYGTKLILSVVGIGMFRSEFLRIVSLPRELNNELYLILLAAAALLTAGWVFVSNKELDIMCSFLDPLEYKIPSESIIGLAIAAALTILLYTARNPLWFGVTYSTYMLLSALIWHHGVGQMKIAIEGSRKNLHGEPKRKREIYSGALDILDSYYIQQANLPRVWTSFALAVLGLAFSVAGSKLHRNICDTVAYLIFIVSIVALELGLAFYWRFLLYTRVQPFEVDKHTFEHRQGHKMAR